MWRVSLAFLCTASVVLAQGNQPGAANPNVDQKRVDAAIEKGLAWLKNAPSPEAHKGINSDGLILLTLVTGGAPENDPKLQELLKRVLEAPLNRTYQVSLLAMCLEEIDRVKYQGRIAQCALFLVDNQCKNGQWSYGEPTPANTIEQDNSVATSGKALDLKGGNDASLPFIYRQKPKVTKRLSVKRTREGPAEGDNSNSQYAALGLRACHDAGVGIPSSVIQLAKQWWMTSAFKPEKIEAREAVSTGGTEVISAPPIGWCYKGYGNCAIRTPHAPNAAMTAGAVGALCIYDYILGVKWKSDPYVRGGISWLGQHFSVTENLNCETDTKPDPRAWLLYYLYALERVGMLYDTTHVGSHDWYKEGAVFLLDGQNADGSWFKSGDSWDKPNPTWDTCYAILFLKKATRKFMDVATTAQPVPNPGPPVPNK